MTNRAEPLDAAKAAAVSIYVTGMDGPDHALSVYLAYQMQTDPPRLRRFLAQLGLSVHPMYEAMDDAEVWACILSDAVTIAEVYEHFAKP